MVQLDTINKILKFKERKNLYEIALDIGISEYSLYCYINSYKKVGTRTIKKIKEYIEKEKL